MAYCGVNPQGYHGINFGSFIPKPSLKVRQLAAASSRKDATTGTAADGEDYYLIQRHRDRRFPGFSLPEIKVKRLFNKPKKKHSRAHTFAGASIEKLRFPAIVPTITEANTINPDAPRRGARNQWMTEDRNERDRRVVRNGEPWWKWARRNHNDDHEQTRKHHSHGQKLPRIETSPTHRDVKHSSKKQKAKHVQHNLRQKLPPLLGYRDDNGNLVFSEAKNTRALGNRYMYNHRDVYLNRRYYYSYSRDGIRPCRPVAKVSNACLFDLSNLQPTNSDYLSHQEAMISSMHDELQAVTGNILPTHGPLQHAKNTGGSNLGAKLKQSLNRDHEQNAKKWKRQPVVINVDSSYADESEFEEEEDDEKAEAVAVAPLTKHPKVLSQNHLRALAILQELINILNSTEFVPGSGYVSKEPGNTVSEIPMLSQINLSDFFQKPESVIKQYDRFKKITSSTHHPHCDDTSAEQAETEHKDSQRKAKKPPCPEEKDRFGLTQLLAVHRLQTESNENLSDMNLDDAAAKLTDRTYDGEDLNKIKSVLESHYNIKDSIHKNGGLAKGGEDQHPGLAQLLAIQQFQALNEKNPNTEEPDVSKNVSEPIHSDEMEIKPALHRKFMQKSLSEKCDVQGHLVCVDLNDQFLHFSNNYGPSRRLKIHPTSRKLVHNPSKSLIIEPSEKPRNSRPDLEVSGETLEHLYKLGLLNSDQELSQLAMKAEECVTVSREQLTKIQEICDSAGVGDSTVPNPEAGDGNLPSIEFRDTYHNGENADFLPEEISSNDHGENEGLHVQINTEQEGGGEMDAQHQLGSTTMKFNRDLSWDLESEFARVQAMDLQQRLQMEQLKKERKVLDSVKRDLQRFQETLQTNGSSNSGSSGNGERPVRQRESLLPPPPPPPRKKNKSRVSKKNEQQIKTQDETTSSIHSASEQEEVGEENVDISILSEMEDDASALSEQHLDEFGDQLASSVPLDNGLESSSVVAVDDMSAREGDKINGDQDTFVDHSEIAADMYPAIPDMIEEESDGYLSDSDIDENAHSDTETHQLSHSGLELKELSEKSAHKGEETEAEINDSAHSEDISARAVYDSVISDLTGSTQEHREHQEHRTGTSQRTNTRGGSRPVSKLVSMDSWSRMDTGGGLGSARSSTSRGMRGSALKSQRGKRTSSSEFKSANIGEDMGPLSVSRPQTVQQFDLDSRSSSGQRSRLPTRERSRKSSRTQVTAAAAADPAQVLAHRKSELARQQLIEAQRKEAQLEQERERQEQEKKIRQAEFEDRMSAALKSEEDEIRRQRKLKAEARKKAEELEKQRQVLLQQMKREEAKREAEEKARHSAMLEGLRQEAERRHLQVMHEKAVIEDYQDRINAFNEWEYAYIDYYLGENYSQQARKIDQSKKLKQERHLQQRMMEAFEYKRRELLEKLKAAQKELMRELEFEKGELDHFLKISRAFVFTYFKRVPDQTFMVPQELLS